MTDTPPESLLPYERWTEDALRQVVARALAFVAANGLPGEHHFYISFRTDHPGVVVPPRLRSQYPREMTIVLQHQFWELKVDREAELFSVGLSFGGVPATLAIPFAALTGFADPHVRFGLQFGAEGAANDAAPEDEPPAEAEDAQTASPEAEVPPEKPPEHQVVSLDAFRRRPGKE